MNILILTNKLPYPPRDGGSIATLNMITGLHGAGNQLTCLAMNTVKHPFPVEQIPPEIRASIRFLGVHCDCSIRPLQMGFNLFFSEKPYIAERFNIPAFRKALGALLLTESFDIIQMEGPYPGQYMDLIRKKSRGRISLRAHNVEHLIWERKALHEKSYLKKCYLNNMARRLKNYETEVLNKVDLLIPISKPDEAYFRRLGFHKPMLTIPAGLNTENYPLTKLPSEPSLFFIGALDWLPNQEGLIWFLNNVFDRLLQVHPGLKFHVAGRNAPVSFERALKHPNIVYHGEVQNATGFMQTYTVMVAPLLSGSGIRVKIIEAMALGRPVVTTSAGIEGIETGDLQSVVVEDDPQKFSDQLVKMLSIPPEITQMLADAHACIGQNFDTFELATRLSQFYTNEV